MGSINMSLRNFLKKNMMCQRYATNQRVRETLALKYKCCSNCD